jgi:hypothetical protein
MKANEDERERESVCKVMEKKEEESRMQEKGKKEEMRVGGEIVAPGELTSQDRGALIQ